MDSSDGRRLFLARNSIMTVSLAHNMSDSNWKDNNFNAPWDPSLLIVIVVVLAVFLFTQAFCIFIRRFTTDEDATTPSTRWGPVTSTEATLGLDRTIIKSFPIFSYHLVKGLKAQPSGTECAVCLSDFHDDEMLRLLPKCSHAFHPDCIDTWLCSHTTCPLCRTTLVPEDQSNPTGNDYEVQAPSEQVAIVVDNGGGVSSHGNVSNDETRNTCSEAGHESPIVVISKAKKFRRSHSTGHSLEKPSEWYIATVDGLIPGLHRSCSFVGFHHSQGQSNCKAPPAGPNKPGSSIGDGGCSSRETCGFKSEMWAGISKNSPSFFRTFSLRAFAAGLRFDGQLSPSKENLRTGQYI